MVYKTYGAKTALESDVTRHLMTSSFANFSSTLVGQLLSTCLNVLKIRSPLKAMSTFTHDTHTKCTNPMGKTYIFNFTSRDLCLYLSWNIISYLNSWIHLLLNEDEKQIRFLFPSPSKSLPKITVLNHPITSFGFMLMRIFIFMNKSVMSQKAQQRFFYGLVSKMLTFFFVISWRPLLAWMDSLPQFVCWNYLRDVLGC